MLVEYTAIIRGKINVPDDSEDGIIGEYILNDMTELQMEGYLTDYIDDIDFLTF